MHPRLAATLRLPYPPYLLRVALRGAFMWLVLRALALAVLAARFSLHDGLFPSPHTRVLLVALAALLVWLDRRRFRESLFLADLGTPPLWLWLAVLGAAGLLDAALQLLLLALAGAA